MLERIKDLGEDQVGKLVSDLLSNERFIGAMQGMMMRSLKTREQLEGIARFLLGTLNIPSKADLEKVMEKLAGLDELLDDLTEKVESIEKRVPAEAAESKPAKARSPKSGGSKGGSPKAAEG